MSSKLGLLVALMLAISASARPAEKRWSGFGGPGGRSWWQPSKASSFVDFTKRAGGDWGSCDLENALPAMNLGSGKLSRHSEVDLITNSNAVSPPLPAPAADMTLFQVVIGRGTQNYTCDLANATATPVPVGAVATLFNVSCIAADMPALLEKLPAIALDLPIPTSNNMLSPINQDMSGHHYFLDSTTPFFNLDTSLHQYGMGAVAKANASDAPSTAYVGTYGKGDGAVQWLTLVANSSNPATGAWKQIYRLNTAGGVPPKMCTGLPPAFEVPYAAEYWLFT